MPSIGAASVTVEIILKGRRSIRPWTAGLTRGIEDTMQTLRASIRPLFVVLCLAAAGLPAVFAATPIITKLTPASVRVGSPEMTVTIAGADFVSGAAAKWTMAGKATPLKTTFVRSTELTAVIPSTALEKAGQAAITVTAPAGVSAAAAFDVLPPRAVITALKPATAIAGGPAFTMTITGKYFVAGATAKWGTTALKTVLNSSTLITATVSNTLIARQGTANVTVTTAGGTSLAAPLTIKPPKPIISVLAPSSGIAGSPQFTLTIDGFNFAAPATVKFGGKTLASATVKSAKLITAVVSAADIASAAAIDVTVTTAKGTSAPARFTVKPPRPTIGSLSPNSASARGLAFTLTANGKNFFAGAVINWGANTHLTATVKSSTQLTVPIASTLIANPGTVDISVTTSSGTSTPAAFQIGPPKPAIATLIPNSIPAGRSAFTLTVNGAFFSKGATVFWNTTQLTTTFVSTGQLKAAVPANLIAGAGHANITVTDSIGTSQAPAVFEIVSSAGPVCADDGTGDARLLGTYSFEFTQVNPASDGQANLNVGTFTADGKGGISEGQIDSNSAFFSAERHNTFVGTYSVGSDNRGLLRIRYTGGGTANFCFALNSLSSGVAEAGRLVSDQTNPQIGSGAFFAHGSSSLNESSVKGSWAFGLQGIALDSSNGDPARGAAAGYLTLDGSGSVSAGEIDISQDKYTAGVLGNTSTAKVAITGTYTLASTGRGTLTLNLGGSGTSDYVFYVAGPRQILLLNTGAGGQGGATVSAGKAYLRPVSSFSNASLSGTSVFVDHALTDTNSTAFNNRLISAGILSWNGKGGYTETFDQNDAGNVLRAQSGHGTYSVDSNGRVSFTGTTPATVGYLIGPGAGFAVNGNTGVTFTYFESQSIPHGGFVESSFDGSYSEGSLWYGFEEQKAESGEIFANGAGELSGNLDVAPFFGGVIDAQPYRGGALLNPERPKADDQGIAETYTAAESGRFVILNGSQPVEALYMVSPDKAYAIDISGAIWQPIEEFDHQ